MDESYIEVGQLRIGINRSLREWLLRYFEEKRRWDTQSRAVGEGQAARRAYSLILMHNYQDAADEIVNALMTRAGFRNAENREISMWDSGALL